MVAGVVGLSSCAVPLMVTVVDVVAGATLKAVRTVGAGELEVTKSWSPPNRAIRACVPTDSAAVDQLAVPGCGPVVVSGTVARTFPGSAGSVGSHGPSQKATVPVTTAEEPSVVLVTVAVMVTVCP